MTTATSRQITSDLYHLSIKELISIPDHHYKDAVRLLGESIGDEPVDRTWAQSGEEDEGRVSWDGAIYVLSGNELHTAKINRDGNTQVYREPLHLRAVTIEEKRVNANEHQPIDCIEVTLHRHSGETPAPIIGTRDMNGHWDDTTALVKWATGLKAQSGAD